MDALPFIKMHGLGNDFVVLDARARPLRLTAAEARAIADRRTGIGCDQIIILAPSSRGEAFMRIHNADGEEVGACGNGTRCVGALLMAESGRERVVVETRAGLLEVAGAGGGAIAVDMGEPGLDWRQIPLAREMDTLHLDLSVGPASAPVLSDPVAVNMGNPHAVFFVAEAAAIDLVTIGPMIEHHPLFPERANVGVVEVLDRGHVRLRVWERGVGVTSACGTAACAAVVAAVRRGLTERAIEVRLDGGSLRLEWNEAGRVIMTGPIATSFTGVLAPELMPREIAA